ncbi:MAG: hypothetical protein GZ094_22950, partial [Mariniphaga sp.]|nr:hypothetical protein [Mariniphaga sp.]
MVKLFVNIFFIGIFFILVSCKTQTANIIDDFENTGITESWTFINDSGTQGTLDYNKAGNGSIACLSWNVADGGRWVGASKNIDTIPKNANGIRLKIKCPGVSTAWLYLVDKNESIYKYRLSRSLTDLDDTQWFSKTVSFNTEPDSISNGSFSPDIAKTLKSIVVAIEPRMDPWFPKDRWFPQPKGDMWFDDVEWVTDYDEPLALANEQQNSIPAAKLWQHTGVCTHFEHGDLNQPDSIKAVG